MGLQERKETVKLMRGSYTFTIIVPIYNAEKTICNCINSLLQQTVPCQILLVDDNSTDNSRGICESYALKYKNIEFYISHNKGVSAARNIGLKHASGDIICFCDADDFYNTNTLEEVNKYFSNIDGLSILIVGINKIKYDNTEPYKEECVLTKSRYVSGKKMVQLMSANQSVMGSVWNKFYRSNILKNAKFDETLTHCEDTHFNCKVLSEYPDIKCLIINKAFYNYIISSSSVTGNLDRAIDDNGRLKYNIAMRAILRECSLDKENRIFVRFLIARFGMEYLCKIKQNDKAYRELTRDVRENICCFILFCWKYNFKSNFRILIKYIFFRLKK